VKDPLLDWVPYRMTGQRGLGLSCDVGFVSFAPFFCLTKVTVTNLEIVRSSGSSCAMILLLSVQNMSEAIEIYAYRVVCRPPPLPCCRGWFGVFARPHGEEEGPDDKVGYQHGRSSSVEEGRVMGRFEELSEY
jgi:hypothetical protein